MSFSASCRLGSGTLVLGQICLKESMKTVIKQDLDFDLNLSFPKDTLGMIRRDVQEDKEKQVQGMLYNKLRQCLNYNIRQESDQDQIMDSIKPLNLILSLNVI